MTAARTSIAALLASVLLSACAGPMSPASAAPQPSTRAASTKHTADATLIVQQFQLPPTTQPSGQVAPQIPADAKPLLSIEQTITFATPFFCAVAQGDRRIEVDGVAHISSDGYCRLEVAYSDRDAQGNISFSTNVMLKPGEPKVLNAFAGKVIAVVLFDNRTPPATAP
jgi:hypothetical protein